MLGRTNAGQDQLSHKLGLSQHNLLRHEAAKRQAE